MTWSGTVTKWCWAEPAEGTLIEVQSRIHVHWS